MFPLWFGFCGTRRKELLRSASVELFLPEFTQGDPYEVATRIREKAEGVMRQA